MRKEFIAVGYSVFFVATSFASYRPVISLSAGADVINIHMNEYVSLQPPFKNNYVSNNHVVDAVSGLFVGVETPMLLNMSSQIGVSYYQNQGYLVRGIIYQFADPAFGNLNYQYSIQSQRFFLESKLFAEVSALYHPFFNIAVGEAINDSTQYVETPVTSADVPALHGFKNKTTHSFAYLLGAGVEMDIAKKARIGVVYRYVNMGNAALSATTSTNTLKNNPLYVNEFLLQLSLLG